LAPIQQPPIRRYYGRRKDDESDSELSLDSDSDQKSPVRQYNIELPKNGSQGNGGASNIKDEKKTSIKDKLKKKMLQQIKKTFKEDKKAEQERQKKMEEEQFYREEELKEMSEKLRMRERERRRLAGESESDEDAGNYSPLTALWKKDRERSPPERKRARSPELPRRRELSRERSRSRSRERLGKSKGRKSEGPRLVDY